MGILYIEANRADLVSSDHALNDHVRLSPTPGHTPDHFAVCAGKGGDKAVFTGDLIHSPMQARYPELGMMVEVPSVQTAPETVAPPGGVTVVPPTLTPPQQPVVAVRVPRNWAEVFTAIRAGRWAEAQAGIATLPRDLLTPVAKAELYTAKRRVSSSRIPIAKTRG